jgi:RHS repeat-associated protein
VGADGTVIIQRAGCACGEDPNGEQRSFQPDGRGGFYSGPGDRGTLKAESGGGFTLQEVTGEITAFGPDGRILYVQDTHGNKVTAAYTDQLLTSLTASTGQALTFSYNSDELVTSVTDSTGRSTTYTYDATNQFLLSVTDFAGRTTSYTYDTSGAPATANALLSIQHPDGTVEHFTYDAQGRLAQSYVDNGTGGSPTIGQVTYAYGPAGEVAATNAAGGTARYFADARGLFVKAEDPLGNVSHFMFDQNENRTQMIDPAGHIINYAYDQDGNLIRATHPGGDIDSATYAGPFDTLTSFTDANGNTTRYGYNSQGDLMSITYANGSGRRFSYDPLGNLTETVNARGQAVQNTYNSMGQLTRATFADGTFQAYTYDAQGNLISASDGSDTTTFQYDPTTEDLVQVNYPGGRSLAFSYDSAGRRARSVDQDGFTVTYTYKLGLLAGLTDGTGSPIVAYTYDATGRLSRKDLGNGTFTTYKYDLDGNVQSLVNHAPGGAVNSRFDYTYSILGNVATMTTLDGAWTYQYDPDGHLTDAVFTSVDAGVVPNQALHYDYDLAGNWTATTVNGVTTAYAVNNMNQYTQIGSATFTYDADGNQITETDATGTTTNTYDQLNRLIGVSSPADRSAYQYDPLGNLAAITHNGQTARYVVDPIGLGNIVGEYGNSGSLSAHYTYGLGLTSRVATGGEAAYYDFDQVGSTVGMSGAAGTYQNLYRYLPFGALLTGSGAIPNAFQFVGRFGVMAQANGLSFMRARFYSSTQGRFLSLDPLGLAGGQSNLYVYADQNPLSVIDPTGEKPKAPQTPKAPQCRARDGKELLDEIIGEQNHIARIEALREELGAAVAAGTVSAAGFANFVLQTEESKKKAQAIIDADTAELAKPECKPKKPKKPKAPKAPIITCPVQVIDPETLTCSPDPKSSDPNAKSGPAGYGPEGFIAADAALPYRISFENDPTATAPAQLVVVTDSLDANIDWSTLQFTEVGFGDNVIAVPAGSQHFQTTLTMTYNGLTFNVLIELAFDTGSGVVTATFQSIDPATGLPPPVLIGFLPPEDGTGRGLGYFSYTAMARTGLPTGTEIRNVATVTFDANQPIATDQVDEHDASMGVDPAKQCLNTLDAGAPTSRLIALPAFSRASFTVNWAGQDDSGGSGIDAFDIYMSDNGGEFTLWQHDTAATSASFTGVDGHSYGFYSAAFDDAGNAQAMPTGAQSTTTVDATPPSSRVAPLPARTATSSFLVSWFGSDTQDGSGIESYSVYASQDGGAFQAFLTQTTQTSATFTGQNGHSYRFYSVASDIAGNVQSTPTSAQTTTTVDAMGPTSSIAPLPAFSQSTFTVSWSGSDYAGGAGLASYSIYVSDNGGAFRPLLTDTTQTATVFQGTDGHRYGFYSIATDIAGNTQPTPDAAQASTLVDVSPPTSNVSALPADTGMAAFAVSWSGSDGAHGSEIADYTIYVSDNGSPFTSWLTGTTQTTAEYGGQDGHRYTFASVATDKAGNVQVVPGVQATTRVDRTPPTSSVSALPAVTTSLSFTVSWSGSGGPNGSGIASYSLFYSDNGGSYTAWVSNTAQTSTTFTGTDGHTYRFYTLATDSAGNPQAAASTIQSTMIVLPADHLVIHTPGQTIPGGTFSVTVSLVNADGVTDPLAGGSIALLISSGPSGGKLSGFVTAPAQNGVATFNGLSFNVAGTYTLLAASTSHLVSVVSDPIAVAPTTHFSVTGAPGTLPAGGSFTITITALMSNGKPDITYQGTIQLTSTEPQVQFPNGSQITFDASSKGVATANVILKTAGKQTVSAADITKAKASGKSSVVKVTAGALDHISVSGYPSSTVSGDSHKLIVKALDLFGNTVTSFRDKVQIISSDQQATMPAIYQFSPGDAGVHSFTIALESVSPQSLMATDLKTNLTASQDNITVVGLAAAISGPTEAVRGQPLTFTLTASETHQAADAMFTYQIDWNGDNKTDQTVIGSASLTTGHMFPATGTFTVKVKVADALGNVMKGPASLATPIAIKPVALEADPADPTKMALYVGGTTGTDTIVIAPTEPTGTSLSVTINNTLQPGGPFSSIAHTIVYGQAGNDTIKLVAAKPSAQSALMSVAVPAILFAGSGNTTLSAAGSSASNILVGGSGNNSLTGGPGQDLLIGGRGTSTLRAGGGGDIVVAGSTAHDTNVATLLAILQEWTRNDRGYVARVKDLFGTGSGGLNGSYLLDASSVLLSGAVDQLFGGAGSDWFWLSPADQMSNYAAGDIATVH